jgi:hypothetical protein
MCTTKYSSSHGQVVIFEIQNKKPTKRNPLAFPSVILAAGVLRLQFMGEKTGVP